MNRIAKPSTYFSAYPLKATEQQQTSPSTSAQSSSPYLKSLLSDSTKPVNSRVRVFPMITPYKDPYEGKIRLSPIERIMKKIPALK
jgi:hypothetical protein